MVIASSLLADLTIERLDSFQVAAGIHEAESKDEWKKRWIMDSIAERQRRWTEETVTAAWTRRVLPDINRWLKRMPGLVVSFHLTQALTGHECFRAYLSERRRAETLHCLWCPGVDEGLNIHCSTARSSKTIERR